METKNSSWIRYVYKTFRNSIILLVRKVFQNKLLTKNLWKGVPLGHHQWEKHLPYDQGTNKEVFKTLKTHFLTKRVITIKKFAILLCVCHCKEYEGFLMVWFPIPNIIIVKEVRGLTSCCSFIKRKLNCLWFYWIQGLSRNKQLTLPNLKFTVKT